MDRRSIVMAVILGGPPGIGMGLAVLSVTRGDALIESIVVGTTATALLVGGIYVIGSRGSVEGTAEPDQLS